MKKSYYLIMLVGVVFILAGCQNLGDRINGKNNSEQKQPETVNSNQATNLEVNSTEKEVVKKEKTVNNIFFKNKKYDPDNKNCYSVYWVNISGDDKIEPLERTLSLLLGGPTEGWLGEGYYSLIPEGTKLNSVKLDGDTVYADFSKELDQVADSCQIKGLNSQITMTIKYAVEKQLNKEVKKVVISVGGKSEGVFKP